MKSGVSGESVSKRSRLKRSFALLVVSCVVGNAYACSGDDAADPDAEEPLPTGEVNIGIAYPSALVARWTRATAPAFAA